MKNSKARLRRPAAVVRPAEIPQVKDCVQWALKHGFGLTIIWGGHSGHCIWSNAVAIDMGAFDQVHISPAGDNGEDSAPWVVVEAGCKTGDVIQKTMAVGLTVPIGARPSVGAGLWLQGGIGHLARSHGLAHQPVGAIRPENGDEILWATKGAGTNFGMVTSVTFKASVAPTYVTQDWTIPLDGSLEMGFRLANFDGLIACRLRRTCCADAYLCLDAEEQRLGVAMFESSTLSLRYETRTPVPCPAILGLENEHKVVDGFGLFDTELNMSGMHGEHGGGKTSSFERCIFLKGISMDDARPFSTALETRPSPLCYLHLLQGGGAVRDVPAEATAFGCRDRDFACVVTGVWPRDRDNTEASRSVVQWVYKVVENLLPLSTGVYRANLGPDPRDAALAAKAFGANLPYLVCLKKNMDPQNVLAYACPLPKLMKSKPIVLVTGNSCVGKDYCAKVWASMISTNTQKNLKAHVVSISDKTKREDVTATSTDLRRLLNNRVYKEQHRSRMTAFFKEEVKQRPRLLQEHFLDVLHGATDVDVPFIHRNERRCPVARLSGLVLESRLLEVRVQAREQTRRLRRGCDSNNDGNDLNNLTRNVEWLDYSPSPTFDNGPSEDDLAKQFAERSPPLLLFHRAGAPE
ncbi:uncharacterized protein A1O9_02420 [Exophiala aquamarina CBS 119918]|uniref:FAD-binding PCMH-type domain-containing protein n=1 Tax=Exophiala aquamarina CBS 119918 TaxID=1182545 RepID=A0A072PNF9_9EURO|nr:uncharacterized protein A1O9_02420 [Exophiala aquamarina CBS 119918]KEF60858.1 hypothetical protein A1O9_02420 [Exophiala aquamarina CBS 119918]